MTEDERKDTTIGPHNTKTVQWPSFEYNTHSLVKDVYSHALIFSDILQSKKSSMLRTYVYRFLSSLYLFFGPFFENRYDAVHLDGV